MWGAPAIGPDHTLYDGAFDHKVYAFPQTSQPIPVALAPNSATPPTDRFIAGGLVDNGVLYIGMGDKGVKAYNTADGSEKWTFTDTAYGVWSTPLMQDGTLYFGSLDHFLYALDPATGKLKWKLDLGGAIGGTPLYDNGTLYVGTFNNELLTISVENHSIAKRFATKGWVWGTPVLKDGVLYFGDLSGTVYALDEKTLAQKWAQNYPNYPGGVRGSPAVVDVKDSTGQATRVVIVGSESKYLMSFKASDGSPYWSAGVSAVSANDQILSDPIVIGDNIIVTTLNDNQVVVAYNIQTGKQSWSVDLNAENTRLQTATSIPLSTDQATAPAATAAATEPK
jgi:outer membrane protein assembly factor BamB